MEGGTGCVVCVGVRRRCRTLSCAAAEDGQTRRRSVPRGTGLRMLFGPAQREEGGHRGVL